MSNNVNNPVIINLAEIKRFILDPNEEIRFFSMREKIIYTRYYIRNMTCFLECPDDNIAKIFEHLSSFCLEYAKLLHAFRIIMGLEKEEGLTFESIHSAVFAAEQVKDSIFVDLVNEKQYIEGDGNHYPLGSITMDFVYKEIDKGYNKLGPVFYNLE